MRELSAKTDAECSDNPPNFGDDRIVVRGLAFDGVKTKFQANMKGKIKRKKNTRAFTNTTTLEELLPANLRNERKTQLGLAKSKNRKGMWSS